MKFTVFPESLQKVLLKAGRIIPSRTTLPILSTLHLIGENGIVRVEGTNLEIGGRFLVGANIEVDGECCVPAKTLIDWVSTVSDEEISFSYNQEQQLLNLKQGKSKAEIKCFDPAEFPVIKLDMPEKVVTFPTDTLRKVVREVVISVATDDSRPILTGVHFSVKEGKVTLEGADGFRLSRSSFVFGTDWEGEAVIPARGISEFIRSVEGDDVTIGVRENQVVFSGNNLTLVSQLIEGNYPDANAVIPVSYKTRVVLSTKGLAQSVKAAMVFARESNNTVFLDFVDNHVKVSSVSAETGKNDSEVGATITGENVKIAVNGKYLLDVLSILGENSVIELNEATNPIVVRDTENDQFVHCVMPMNLGR